MEIKKIAVAGTLESSDCMVTVEPAKKGIELCNKAVRKTDKKGSAGDTEASWSTQCQDKHSRQGRS